MTIPSHGNCNHHTLDMPADVLQSPAMNNLDEIVGFLDRELKINAIPDYPGAVNGLQLANEGRVERIFSAVDASLPVILEAAAGGPALLLVHHGLFWQGAQPVTGPVFRKLKTAMDAGLAIYSAHLPLDIHPLWGNNIQLARAIGMGSPQPFLDWKGLPVGLRGAWTGSREDLLHAVSQAVGGGRVHLSPGGPPQIREISLITGGAGSEVVKAAQAGSDTFISGEGPHWSHPLALEYGVNLLLAGHYATETFGVQTLGVELGRRFGLGCAFIDHPSGL